MTPDHHRRGVLLFEARRHALAAETFLAALAEDPSNAGALEMLARCHLHLDRVGEALDCARRAVALAPDWCGSHDALARAELARGEARAALEAVDQALRLHPEEPEHHELRASVLDELLEYEAALGAADAGLAMDPGHVGCLNRRALALRALGETELELETLATTLQVAPENATAHALRGWTMMKTNQLPAARSHLEEALRQAPGYRWAEMGLGRLNWLERPWSVRLRHWAFDRSLVGGGLRIIALVVFVCLSPDPWGPVVVFAVLGFGILALPAMLALEIRDWLRTRRGKRTERHSHR